MRVTFLILLLPFFYPAQAFSNYLQNSQQVQTHHSGIYANSSPQPQGNIVALSMSWPASDYHNPFSTQQTVYEIWHDGFYIKTVSDNKVVFELALYPQLTGGCFQIRRIDERGVSPLSGQSCYSLPHGFSNNCYPLQYTDCTNIDFDRYLLAG